MRTSTQPAAASASAPQPNLRQAGLPLGDTTNLRAKFTSRETSVEHKWKAFDGWIKTSADARGNAISIETSTQYRFVWRAWLRYLEDAKVTWDQAQHDDMQRFLKSAVYPSSHRHSEISPVTKHRYWSVLGDIYSYAMFNGLCTMNPARRLTESHRNVVPPTERMASCRLSTLHLAAIKDALVRFRFSHDDIPGAAPWNALRNRAMISILLDQGPTSSEITNLRPSQVHPYKQQYCLMIDGERPAQRRELLLSPATSATLRAWLQYHESLATRPDLLFFSQKGRGAITKNAFFSIVNAFLAPTLESMGMGNTQHQGPALIRNTVIQNWLANGVDRKAVIARAGLLEEQCLRRLESAEFTAV